MDNVLRLDILELLARDSRVTPGQIARLLGKEENEVLREISNLESEGVILAYKTLVNWEKAGVDSVAALIDVKVTPQRDVGFDEVAERIYRYPEVVSVSLISGSYDLSVVVQGKTLKEVALFVAERLATLEHVQSTMTHFILRKYKEDGIIYEDRESDRRQVVTL